MKLEEIKAHIRNGAYIRHSRMTDKDDEIVLHDHRNKNLGDIGRFFNKLCEQNFISTQSSMYKGSQNTYYFLNTDSKIDVSLNDMLNEAVQGRTTDFKDWDEWINSKAAIHNTDITTKIVKMAMELYRPTH